MPLAYIDFLDEPIETLSVEMTRDLTAMESGDPPGPPEEVHGAGETAAPGTAGGPLPFVQAMSVLDTIPGVDQRSAALRVAEWGTDMRRFGTASRLSAWTGVAPRHDDSVGKRRSGKTRQGNRALHAGLTQRAHAAVRTKETYLSAVYQRLAARRGKKRVMMAVAHTIVVSAFHTLSRHEPYHELGPAYFDEQRREHPVDRLTWRIECWGYRLRLERVAAS